MSRKRVAALPLRAGLAAALALAAAPAGAGVPPAYGGRIRVLLPAPPAVSDPARAEEPQDLALARALHAPLLQVDRGGLLAPGLLEEVPAPELGGRAFRLRLAPGLRFADGTPLVAADVAASLSRLLARDPPSPHAWVALAIAGADAVRDGRAAAPSGLAVVSDRELLVSLAFPLPEFPWALAALPAAVISPRGAGAGPFVIAARDGREVRLSANPHHARGLPYAGEVALAGADARGAARALAAAEAELVLRPEAAGSATAPGPALLATVAAVNGPRLGAEAGAVRSALGALDRAELARLFVRGPAVALAGLVPPALLPPAGADAPPTAPAPPAPAPSPRPGAARLTLLVLAGAPDQRAAADRIQVKLFDRGLRAVVEEEEAPRFQARIAAGDYDLALVRVPVLGLAPALAAGQVALATRGPAACRRALAAMAGLPPEAVRAEAAALARALDLVPLFAAGLRASAAPALQGATPGPDGTVDAGDLWLLGGGR